MKKLSLILSVLIITFTACQEQIKDEVIERVQNSELRLIDTKKEEQTIFNRPFSTTSYLIEADVRLQSSCEVVDATFDTCRLTYKLSLIHTADFDVQENFDATIAEFKSTADLGDDFIQLIDFGPKKICVNGDCTFLLLNEKEDEGLLIYLDDKLYRLELANRNSCKGWYPLTGFYQQHLNKLLNVDPERLALSNSKI